MKNKLIPLTQFVNNIDELIPREIGQMHDIWRQLQLLAIKNYSSFLSKPLKLEYFVPCVDGKPFTEFQLNVISSNDKVEQLRNSYKEAESKVLFEGFEWIEAMRQAKSNKCIVDKMVLDREKHTIEALLTYDITLTPTALKQIYG